MGSFNWINFEAACPRCSEESPIRCQVHVASSYNGDEVGRFHDREYRLGDKMGWWVAGHKYFARWKDGSDGGHHNLAPDQAVEACYASCVSCKASLCAVILLEDLRPTRVVFLGLEADWLWEYSK